ncbi:flagellar basal body-associated protein FliL [Nereida sp. MMG025]|uniref:flagellar basal body-associated FliL family protein n=1 Tax=Nereida sp. MMG025 TaxID=2909981 RepID=UPI001F0087CB|nr:flagellar basal body-associated FliL family protein [Nereida sp. MMG025]MCF6444666.1 flagellar basal body-associated FliL family protein [Nereida sp. MMG025]
MAEEEGTEDAPQKRSKLPLIIGVLVALIGGGGAFYVTSSGGSDAGEETAETAPEKQIEPLGEVSFVPLEPLVINLAQSTRNTHLRFRANLEVDTAYVTDVETVLPRVVDVLNSYLRAVSVQDLEDPSSLIRIRAQMLRRVQLVTGEGRVNDLLIMEFVLT